MVVVAVAVKVSEGAAPPCTGKRLQFPRSSLQIRLAIAHVRL
jgi:hypothetical protein